jgi:nucleoside-diphosphate-sugar epimerase
MKVLVTGATGFVGRHLVTRLVNTGHEVRALVSPGRNDSWLRQLGVEIVNGYVEDRTAVDRAVEARQIVFHLAAKTESLGLLSRKDVRAVNIQGTENIARAALRARVDRLVYSSSVSVYGRVRHNHKIDEETEPRPDSPYGESKVRAEQIIQSCQREDRLPAVVARLSTVWGTGAISWLGLFQRIAAQQFSIFGEGTNHHHLVDVDDIVDGLLLCSSVQGVEGRTYILAGPQSVPLRDLVRMISHEVGVASSPVCRSAFPLHVYKVLNGWTTSVLGRNLPRSDRLAIFLGDRSFDIARARTELGYSPKISTSATVHRLAEWFRSEGHLPVSNGLVSR